MSTPGENLSNAPVIDVKKGLSFLKDKIETDTTNVDADGTLDEMSRVKAQFAEAKTAAATADKEALEDLSHQIDATDSPLDQFISDAYLEDAINAATEAEAFKNEVKQLKTVVKEKIAEPRTLTDKVIYFAEKAADGIGNVMGKIGKWASDLSVEAMKGLKSFFAMIGFPAGVTFLDEYLKPAEVRETIKDVLGEKAIVEKDKSDASALRNLEAAHKKELETGKDLTFEAFCRERAEELKKKPAQTAYKIADLLLSTGATVPPGTPSPVVPPPTPGAGPASGPNQAPEKANLRRAAHLFILAEALGKSGVPLERTTYPVINGRSSHQGKTETIDLATKIIPERLSTAASVSAALKETEAVVYNAFHRADLYTTLPLKLKGNKLQFENGSYWGLDPDLIDTFNPSGDPEPAINKLLSFKIENGELILGSGRDPIKLSDAQKNQLQPFLENLKVANEKFKKII